MTDLEQYIERFLGNDPFHTYFVACSGGVDSMVLLHVLLKLKKRVSAVHVNYMLRGEDSENDQQLVEDFCKNAGIPCHVKRIDLNKYLLETGGNLQETARKVRYAYFENFKIKKDFRIVLGQHADDQVETFFLHLARGGGIMGLACMLPEHDQYVRPLLTFTKEEIKTYAEENQISWREDVSNQSSRYNRNKLRNLLLPEMRSVIPDLNDAVLTLVHVFQETQRSFELEMDPIIKTIVASGELSFEQFDQLNEFKLTEILRQLELPFTLVDELKKLRTAQVGKAIETEHKKYKQIIAERDLFFFDPQESVPIPELMFESLRSLPDHFDKTAIYLDPDKINGRLELRYWQEGDRIKPIGLKGSKLISDILSDAKIPNHKKRKQLVLTDKEKILWLVGYSISREAIANADSAILKVSLAEKNH
jgi:tRNA(Ile)-lysidine synthase